MSEIRPEEKLDRWEDFALRMARACYAKRQNPDLDRITAQIESFFVDYVDRDRAAEYHSWDEGPSDSNPCDMVYEAFEDAWIFPMAHATDRQIPLLEHYWRREEYDKYDEIRQAIAERWREPAEICIRSGIDFALEQSAGVVGFTALTLRQMWPEGVPDWIRQRYIVDFDSIADDAELLF